MTERRRARLLLALLLALGGFGGASGAYVAFGPSASSGQVDGSDTLTGVGHAEVGTVGPSVSDPGPDDQRPRHRLDQHDSGHGPVKVGEDGPHHRHSGPHHGRAQAQHPHPGPSPIPGNHRLGVTVGGLRGLYPGLADRLPVTYTNPNPFPVSVTKVLVDSPGTRACGRQYFVTGTYPQAAPVRIPGRSSVSTTVPFGMTSSAPNACQGVAVRVDVTATAVKR